MKNVALLLGIVLLGASVPAPSADKTDEELSPVVRSLLAQRMEHHALSASELQWAVIFLETEEAKRIATDLAAEPRIARPLPGQLDELNTRIPVRFFDLQDQMTKRARALADAAEKGDTDEIVFRYGDLVHACVSCHAAYME